MKNIHVLDESVANLIAAGEVVERPAAAVKEMVENAIDAGASKIYVTIRNGGIKSIMVTDDGNGIAREDVPYAFLPHATSKISNASDLNAIYTLGFRGEALASIAAVSKIKLTTKTMEDKFATYMEMEAGELLDITDKGGADGTTIIVEDLFYNTPARMKFLKKDSTEAGYIGDILLRYALSYPNISFKFIDSGKLKFFTPGDNCLANCLYVLYGKEYSENAREVNYENEYAKVTGLFVAPNIVRKNSNYQSFFVNHRYIKSTILSAAVKEACKEKVVAGNFPVFCLNVEVNPNLVDVNVHPSKLEVKFSNEREIFDVVYWGVKNALEQSQIIYNFKPPEKKENAELKPKQILNKSYQIKASSSDLPLHEANTVKYQKNMQNPPNYSASFEVQTVWGKETLKEGEMKPSEPTKEPQNLPLDGKNIESEASQDAEADSITMVKNDVNLISEENMPIKEQISFKESAPHYRHIIGQLFKTYLLVEDGEDLLIIDQHAAHERLNFERLKTEYENRKIYSQVLLEPVTIDLSPVEYQKVINHLDFFNKLGFEAEDFGNNAVIVRMAPQDLNSGNIKDLFLEMLNVIGTRGEEKTIVEKALHMVACRSSIKANDKMNMAEMEKLLSDVLKLEDKNTCPHGRPIILTMSKKEIEKGFFRIV